MAIGNHLDANMFKEEVGGRMEEVGGSRRGNEV